MHNRTVPPEVDNMLKITTDGRKIGLDARLMNPNLPDFPGSKVNACVDNVFRIWEETTPNSSSQLIFCDYSTPNKSGRFNLYDDIKEKLIAKGIPEHEIAFVHDADSDKQKRKLFSKVRTGKIRVLIGSTAMLGAGTNLQDKLIASHDLDCPWRPSDLEQRAGRSIRFGNENPEVSIFRYCTSGTFDAYLWQAIQKKQEHIAQIMSSKTPARSCEDVDETALSYAEIKAFCAGDPRIKEKMELDNDIARLRMLKSEHSSQHYYLEDSLLKTFPQQIATISGRIEGITKDIANYNIQKENCNEVTVVNGAASVSSKFLGMIINDVTYTEKETAGHALLDACKRSMDRTDTSIGEYIGFKLSLNFDSFTRQIKLNMRGNLTYQLELGTDIFGNITRLNHALDDLPKRLENMQAQLNTLHEQQENTKAELEIPFEQEDELNSKESRLALLNTELNIGGDGDFVIEGDSESNDKTEAEQNSDVQSEIKNSTQYSATDKSGYTEPRTGTYGKTAPSFLDTIRNLGERKRENPPSNGKSADLEI